MLGGREQARSSGPSLGFGRRVRQSKQSCMEANLTGEVCATSWIRISLGVSYSTDPAGS